MLAIISDLKVVDRIEVILVCKSMLDPILPDIDPVEVNNLEDPWFALQRRIKSINIGRNF